MRTILKVPASLRADALDDLRRPHRVAFERVGFFVARAGALLDGGAILVACEYLPVEDDAYLPDEDIGARVSADGFRPARQRALRDAVSIIHVHLHEHHGAPGFGGVDARESRVFMEDFLKVRPDQPHAVLILSADSATARIWMRGLRPATPIDKVSFVGTSITTVHHA